MNKKSKTKTTENNYTKEAYLRAKALDSLAGVAFALSNAVDSVSEDLAHEYAGISSKLNEEARDLFPLYPHPDHAIGSQWSRDHGFGP